MHSGGFLRLLVLCVTAAAQQCYWPNHRAVSDDGKSKKMIACPAGPETSVSSCCYENDYCTSNGLCLESLGWTYYRGGCTDKTFNSPSCGRYCYGDSPGGVDGSHCGVWPCGANKFSCNIKSCETSNFTISAGNLLANAALKDDLNNGSNGDPTSNGTAEATVTVTNAPEDGTCPAGVSTAAAAGIGAGVGLPLLLAAVSFLILFLREKKKSSGYAAPSDQVQSTEKWSGGRADNANSAPVSEMGGNTNPRYELHA